MKKIIIIIVAILGVAAVLQFTPGVKNKSKADSWIPYFKQVKSVKSKRSPLQEIMPSELRFNGVGAMSVSVKAKAGTKSGVVPFNGKGSYRSTIVSCQGDGCYTAVFTKDPETVKEVLDKHQGWLSAIDRCYDESQFQCQQQGWAAFGQEHGIDVVGAMYEYLDNYGPNGAPCNEVMICQQLKAILGPLLVRS